MNTTDTNINQPIPSEPILDHAGTPTMQKSNKKLLLVLFSIIVIGLMIFGAIVFKTSHKSDQLTVAQNNSTTTPTVAALVLPTYIPHAQYFKTQLIKGKSMMLQSAEYPRILYSIPENNLVGMVCYTSNGREDLYTDYHYQQDDAREKQYYQYLESTPFFTDYVTKTGDRDHSGVNVEFCDTEDNRSIVRYQIFSNMSPASDIYISEQVGTEFKNTVVIPRLDKKYTSCIQSLALTKDGIFYFECSGGEQSSQFSDVYEVNLQTKAQKIIQSCHYQTTAGKENVVCK